MNWQVFHNGWFVVSIVLWVLGAILTGVYADEAGFTRVTIRVVLIVVFWPVGIVWGIAAGTWQKWIDR